MSSISKREKILVMFAAVGILFVLFRYGYFVFQKKSIATQTKLSQIQSEIAKQTLSVVTLTQARSPSSRSPGDQKLQKYLEENSQFTAFIERLSGQPGFEELNLVSVTAQNVDEQASFTQIKYTLALEAPYNLVGQFMLSLELSQLFIEVKSFELQHVPHDLNKIISKIELFNYVTRR